VTIDPMHTVAEARAWALEEFKKARIESPALSADLLLGFVLGCERVRILTHPEQPVREKDWDLFGRLAIRRAAGEPLQYLTGKQEFYGLDFKVSPAVLIPRPETEILVEAAVKLMKRSSNPSPRFADVGTGSGCIAISVAYELPLTSGCAIDISAAALDVARDNALRHGVLGRILFVQANFLESAPEKPCFDFVLSNPPYIAREEYDSLPSVVKDYEPRRALYGGEAGLEAYCKLIPGAAKRLFAGGRLLLELGAGQAEPVAQLIARESLSLEMIINDLQGIPRCLIARKLVPKIDSNHNIRASVSVSESVSKVTTKADSDHDTDPDADADSFGKSCHFHARRRAAAHG
jgi:release factor glutamine methyltransferase